MLSCQFQFLLLHIPMRPHLNSILHQYFHIILISFSLLSMFFSFRFSLSVTCYVHNIIETVLLQALCKNRHAISFYTYRTAAFSLVSLQSFLFCNLGQSFVYLYYFSFEGIHFCTFRKRFFFGTL